MSVNHTPSSQPYRDEWRIITPFVVVVVVVVVVRVVVVVKVVVVIVRVVVVVVIVAVVVVTGTRKTIEFTIENITQKDNSQSTPSQWRTNIRSVPLRIKRHFSENMYRVKQLRLECGRLHYDPVQHHSSLPVFRRNLQGRELRRLRVIP